MTNKILGALAAPLLFSFLLLAQAMGTPVNSKQAPQTKAPATTTIKERSVPSINVDQATLDKGKRLYLSNCISCHNKDPNVKGAIGPEMVDAPFEVMTAKVMTGKYPEKLPADFVPKRKTKLMRPIIKLEKDLPAIYAWVQSVKKKK